MNRNLNWNLIWHWPFDRLAGIALACALAGPGFAWAQSVCSSDGQVPPRSLVDRFTDADCPTCWRSPASQALNQGDLAIDWIVPSAQGEDAPLSAAASRDAVERLKHLKRMLNGSSLSVRSRAGKQALRVARGFALNGYMGASIALKLPKTSPLRQQTLTAWLLLVQEIPAGTEGSPIDRLLVRNVLVTTWKAPQASGSNPQQLLESRPMSLPEGSNPDQMQVVGWVQNPRHQVIAIAASRCARQPA